MPSAARRGNRTGEHGVGYGKASSRARRSSMATRRSPGGCARSQMLDAGNLFGSRKILLPA
ncbi:MAG: hypothetical protein R3C69_09300 [Geminicoccaceae bacterium]